jgi:hypothetical protein
MAPKLRWTEVLARVTPVWKGPLSVFGEEGPKIKVLDAVAAVDVMQGGPLAERDTYEPLCVEAPEIVVSAKERGEIVPGQRGETREVSVVDQFAGPQGRPHRPSLRRHGEHLQDGGGLAHLVEQRPERPAGDVDYEYAGTSVPLGDHRLVSARSGRATMARTRPRSDWSCGIGHHTSTDASS